LILKAENSPEGGIYANLVKLQFDNVNLLVE